MGNETGDGDSEMATALAAVEQLEGLRGPARARIAGFDDSLEKARKAVEAIRKRKR